MATDLSTIADLATWPGFQRRVRAAVVHAAVDIGHETGDDSNYSILRRGLVGKVFDNLTHWTIQFSWAVAANPVISYDPSDNDVQWTVNSVWDALAGAGTPPETEATG